VCVCVKDTVGTLKYYWWLDSIHRIDTRQKIKLFNSITMINRKKQQ